MRRPRFIEASQGFYECAPIEPHTPPMIVKTAVTAAMIQSTGLESCMARKAHAKGNKIDPASSAEVQKSSLATNTAVRTMNAIRIERFIRLQDFGESEARG